MLSPAPDPALLEEIDRMSRCGDARADMIAALTREVSDLRCILREIRDLSTEETIRHLAASRLIQ